MAKKNIVCVYCNVCVHLLPDCCHFLGDWLSYIDCYKTRHFHILSHAVRDRDSCQPIAHASNDGKKEVKNKDLANKNSTSQDLNASHESDGVVDDATLKMKEPPKRVDEEEQTDDKKPAAKENVQDKKKRRNPKLPLHLNSTCLLAKLIGKSPDMDLDLVDTESESDDKIWEDNLKPWKLITPLKEREMRDSKQAAKDRQKRGCRARGIPDEADLELLRAAKKQRREERKLEIIQEHQEKAYNAELKRLEQATAKKSMPVHQRDIERCTDILPQMWKRGARPNVLSRVKDEMSTIWPIMAKTEFTDREVTELFKIRYLPLNPSHGVDKAQYHALQMTTKPGEEEGKTIKKTVLLKRLNPAWMGQRFDAKFLKMVRTASSKAEWIYVPVGDARQDGRPPSHLVAKFLVHYTQKNHDTCLFKSVASALHHLNKKQIASVVSSMATKYMYTPVDKQLNQLGSIAQEKDAELLVTKWMTRKRVGEIDPKKKHPIVGRSW
jgi:hypothetical protein